MTKWADMRKFVVAFVLLAGFGGMLLAGAIAGLLGTGGGGQQSADCSIGAAGDAAQGAQKAASLSPESLGISQRIIDVGRQRNLPPRAWQIAIQAGNTESSLTDIAHGDRDSLGVFQMRPSQGWGTPAQLLDVNYSINKFYDVLQTTPGWEGMRPGEAAQAVESSGFPLRYHQGEAMAAHLVSTQGNGASVSSCRNLPPAGELAARAMAYASAQTGKPYVWGSAGPDAFDCSGLVQQAWHAAGIEIPKYSRSQYFQGGTQLPINQAQPGDLVFWGYGRDPAAIHHVAMYTGNNEVLQAPEPGQTVQRHPIWDGGELLPMAVRPGTPPATTAQAAGPGQQPPPAQ